MNVLETGSPAAPFSASDQHGNLLDLEHFRGKKLILYFYPKDNTSGCTAQACSLRDEYHEIKKLGAEVIGVSIDNMESHRKFAAKNNLPFRLLVDEDTSIVRAYGVYGEKTMYGKKYMGTHRVTYVISEKGIVEHIFTKVKTSSHGSEIIAYLKQAKT